VLAITLPDWITPGNLRVIALAVGLGALVLAFVVMRFVQKLVIRLTLTAVLVAIGALAWYERADLADCAKTCECNIVGFDVRIPKEDLPANATVVCGESVK
jgi:hypothetical protein